MKNHFLFVLVAGVSLAFSSDKAAYRIYNVDGKPVKYEKMVQSASKADVVLFGELHNNPICHWLQLELTRDLFDISGEKLVLGAEMFEADNQEMIDELMAGKIRMKDFDNEARLWPNYKTDYKPLLQFALENKLKFVAANVPRRYAAMVSRKGFEQLDSLSANAKKWISPLPVPYDAELKGYKEMVTMMGPGHENINLPKAQALKDATMAWFILKNLPDGGQFLHFNGTYHSDNYEGIVWYLNHWRPGLKILTIGSASVAEPEALPDSLAGKADYLLTIHERMTTTH